MMYCSDTQLITKAQQRKMEVTDIKMLRWMSGRQYRYGRIRNDYMRGTVEVIHREESRLVCLDTFREEGTTTLRKELTMQRQKRRGTKGEVGKQCSRCLREKGWRKQRHWLEMYGRGGSGNLNPILCDVGKVWDKEEVLTIYTYCRRHSRAI